jgi:hypothetical protein
MRERNDLSPAGRRRAGPFLIALRPVSPQQHRYDPD